MGEVKSLVISRSVGLLLVVLAIAVSCSKTPTAPTPPPPPPVADAPSLACGEGVSRATVNASGMPVNYDTPPVTGGQGSVTVSCSPPSGDNFPIGLLATVLSPPTTDIVSKTPTHVLVRIERVRVKPEAGAQGERELAPGAQVRIVKFDGAWAMVAIDGQELGYVPSEALARLH